MFHEKKLPVYKFCDKTTNDGQHLWLGPKVPIVLAKGWSPPLKLEKAARRAVIILFFIKINVLKMRV